MVHTLQTSTDEWEKISTKTIDDHVRLCHLQSLFMQLEESMNVGVYFSSSFFINIFH